MNLGLAIDRSGSMIGDPMDRAIQAAVHVVQQMKPGDRISVVDVLAPSQPVGDVRAIVDRLMSLTARGGTYLHGGWS
ncbi:hypothetical protein IV102_26600 [bacterium]|nr:hypothetical protein [bacterium]